MNVSTIGSRLRDQRKFKGWTQEDLAKKIGVSTMSIRRYECGERIIPERTLQRIADVLGFSTKYLTDWDPAINYLEDIMGDLEEVGLSLDDVAEELEIPVSMLMMIVEGSESVSVLAIERIIHVMLSLKNQVKRHHPVQLCNHKILETYNQLNPTGQRVALERVTELTQIPAYQKDKKLPQDSE